MSAQLPTEDSLENMMTGLRATLDATNLARERALRLSREVIQYSARTIRAVHRGEMENAAALVREAKERVESLMEALEEHPEVYFAGYVHDSQKEYVEAEVMIAIVGNGPIPSPATLGVQPAAYLNGIAEAASESRRYVLDQLRTGEIDRADAVLKIMDDIYYELITFDFPDAITGGLRRTTDALRAVLERTRGDLTLTLAQKRLEQALEQASAAADIPVSRVPGAPASA
jgi:translin